MWVHIASAAGTQEKAIGGRTSGLCEWGDEILWEARHLGIVQQLRVRITQMHAPMFFEDQMVHGAFRSMRHEHHFKEKDSGTLMIDLFYYEVPYGWIGQVFNRVILKGYMRRFLQTRNKLLKQMAENPTTSAQNPIS